MLSHFSCVQLFAILWAVAHQAPSVHGILQARILEWVAMPSSRGSSQPMDQTHISYISPALTVRLFTTASPGKPIYIYMYMCIFIYN